MRGTIGAVQGLWERRHRFLRRSSAVRRLLIEAVWLLAVIRLGLWLLPFHRLQALLTRLAAAGSDAPEAGETAVARATWAVGWASRFVPGSRCLPQALAAKVLLARRGRTACLRIGVRRGRGRRLEAHAWLERQGGVVIGGEESPSAYETVPVSFVGSTRH